MSIRKSEFVFGEFYHIYNRGNSKQKIFHDKQDYERFVRLLFLANSQKNFNFFNIIKGGNLYIFNRGEELVNIGAYVLMPNHFHLLITPTENGSISKFMQKLTTAYVMYHNEKYKRTGSLFEGKFKSKHTNNDRYLKYIFSYIHLNPLKILYPKGHTKIKSTRAGLDFLQDYTYSSYQDYKGSDRDERIIINRKLFPKYFPSQKAFEHEIFDWVNYSGDLNC